MLREGTPPEFDVMESCPEMLERTCDYQNPCCTLVILYAKMALHRYNLLNKTNFKLTCVYKYSYTSIRIAPSYYISLLAMDAQDNVQLFKAQVDEHQSKVFALTAYLAKAEDPFSAPLSNNYMAVNLPAFPPQNPFHHKKPFHVLTEKQLLYDMLQGDCICLYLQLAVATTNSPHDLSNLDIVKVSVETTGNPNEALSVPSNATFYISYKDPCEARVGKDVDRAAVVTRIIDEPTGCFKLVGQTFSADIIPTRKRQRHNQRGRQNKHKKLCYS